MTTAFTPYSALAGGALIGLSALILWIGLGRIAGISGITQSILFSTQGRGWRLAFIVAMLAAATGVHWWIKWDHGYNLVVPVELAIVAGLLVGIGTAIGSGCTSGHGVCGVSRLSTRSLVATGVFMIFGFATAMLAQALVGS